MDLGGGGSWGSMEPPFGLDLVQRSTGDRLTRTPVWVKNYKISFCGSPQHALAKISIEKQGIDREDKKLLSKTLENGRGFRQKWAWPPNFRAQYLQFLGQFNAREKRQSKA